MSTYKIHTRCANCGAETTVPQQMVEIPKGVTIEDALSIKACEHCGCRTLRESKFY